MAASPANNHQHALLLFACGSPKWCSQHLQFTYWPDFQRGWAPITQWGLQPAENQGIYWGRGYCSKNKIPESTARDSLIRFLFNREVVEKVQIATATIPHWYSMAMANQEIIFVCGPDWLVGKNSPVLARGWLGCFTSCWPSHFMFLSGPVNELEIPGYP